MPRHPAIFVSHGAPTLVLDPSPARDFLGKLADVAAKPKAVLLVSAHWETERPALSVAATPETIHDFYGFPEPLYQIRYPAPGAPDLARQAAGLIDGAGMGPVSFEDRGLDHGAWVPMQLAYPAADVPVTQLSIQPHLGPEHHFRIGEALRPLRDDGVLILASGGLTHNLGEFRGRAPDAVAPDWVSAFDQWFGWAVAEGRIDDLLNYRTRAPQAVRNHPTDEHLLPVFVALGAGDPCVPGRHLHKSHSYGVLAMDAYAFH
ncbi:MAG: class III extradiol ring-cleavage dioxygenase [Proteobacteria bacterium]|nr:class III extradiol ring-cleavage dioxygenase [Pseudomonadota bacterium]